MTLFQLQQRPTNSPMNSYETTLLATGLHVFVNLWLRQHYANRTSPIIDTITHVEHSKCRQPSATSFLHERSHSSVSQRHVWQGKSAKATFPKTILYTEACVVGIGSHWIKFLVGWFEDGEAARQCWWLVVVMRQTHEPCEMKRYKCNTLSYWNVALMKWIPHQCLTGRINRACKQMCLLLSRCWWTSKTRRPVCLASLLFLFWEEI